MSYCSRAMPRRDVGRPDAHGLRPGVRPGSTGRCAWALRLGSATPGAVARAPRRKPLRHVPGLGVRCMGGGGLTRRGRVTHVHRKSVAVERAHKRCHGGGVDQRRRVELQLYLLPWAIRRLLGCLFALMNACIILA